MLLLSFQISDAARRCAQILRMVGSCNIDSDQPKRDIVAALRLSRLCLKLRLTRSCLLDAQEAVQQHATILGFPANVIEEVKNVVSPATADFCLRSA